MNESTKPENETRRLKHLRHFNLGNVYTWMGQHEEAMEQIILAQQMVREVFGARTHWDVIGDYKLETVYFEQANWKSAREALDHALPAFMNIGHIHPSTSATLLGLACVDMEEGKVDDAITGLKKTLKMCHHAKEITAI
ncbi:hypothetical protein BCR34DRAFT_580375 [Clohesyomyces aquaticus]|uniref:MalT-like TPR region domain-containing protein n=1 Tax=Clohesyomyces aquaticus TaxID=1231657 RepID=A0A1Y1Y6M1_9PLEO|nr:hypothetical protein BCR34DRAFT_580375 [Clohesyomyces aquaticus]